MTNAVLSESAFDAVVTALPSAHHRAALYRHNIFLNAELTKAKAELASALAAQERAEEQARAAVKIAEKAQLSDNEVDVRADERVRVAEIIERHSVGETVRAKNGQKIAHMIRSGEWK